MFLSWNEHNNTIFWFVSSDFSLSSLRSDFSLYGFSRLSQQARVKSLLSPAHPLNTTPATRASEEECGVSPTLLKPFTQHQMDRGYGHMTGRYRGPSPKLGPLRNGFGGEVARMGVQGTEKGQLKITHS
ncbi:hypothetical protein DPEC_G00258380 [Dallia pectoralis]|uniref:Uncharacterized protein n=1 Tax=Dallia pectoralis TaxID=75939 RepID=A0ACC2FR16_DALPE|nr:hypothetical protein DPEC_G00258380 [Dallia pectoralis]